MPSAIYGFTDTWINFVAPDGVRQITVNMVGGGSNTVKSGRVQGILNVAKNESLWLFVGRGGKPNSGATGGPLDGASGGGAGGNGVSANGGWSGGGFSEIRTGSKVGTILCVGGGAGGQSGDGGLGGLGGGSIGGTGQPGNAGPNVSLGGTGGTQSQGGNGGQSPVSNSFDGANASNALVTFAGNGGTTDGSAGPGGGGGGAGYTGGGGGAAGKAGYSTGSGGGGGSNLTLHLASATNGQGTGVTGDGQITLTWETSATHPIPNTPTDVEPVSETATLSTGIVDVSAIVSVTGGGTLKLLVHYSTKSTFDTYGSVLGTNVYQSGTRAHAVLTGLAQNTHYFIRCYAYDIYNTSVGFAGSDFYTNRAPLAPTLLTPRAGQQFTTLDSITFSWTPSDPDNSGQAGAQVRWREAASTTYTTQTINGGFQQIVENPGLFKSNTFYMWSVRTLDPQGAWGPWADEQRFFVSGTTSPPIPLSPIKNVAVDSSLPITLSWRFVDPDPGDVQNKADIRYRAVGSGDISWQVLFGDTTLPGQATKWTLPAETFPGGINYEWQARTYDTLGGGSGPSDWSVSGTFWTVDAPGSQAEPPVPPANSVPMGSLGCGEYRVFIYDRGGKRRIGEVTQISHGQWGRTRDDISSSLVTVAGFDSDCGELLGATRSMRHEMVIYRNGQRVHEGPITRIEYATDHITLEARDVMQYVYRRALRQGYDDSYPNLTSVVDRAFRIVLNALAPDDPNVLPYITTVAYPDDAKESRVRADFASSAWEEVDDMAATAGLDYTVIGRRILFWDTHRPIGRLPMMRDGDFSNPPIVTEYGMSLATAYAVINGTGLYGEAFAPTAESAYYGLVELVSSAYGETAQTAAADETLTPAAQEALVDAFTTQAQRNIANRYPSPLLVHVPDNSSLSPEVGVDINYLVPGVWIPLQATATVRKVTQWQKLDSMTVDWDPSGENVQVVMSPAPGAGDDPDQAGTDPNA